MKTPHLFLALCLLALCACRQPAITFTDDDIAEAAKSLIDGVPDHVFNLDCSTAFTPEYFTLLRDAWAKPSDAGEGMIGSEEWLYYFISGNGDCDCPSHPKTVTAVNRQSDTTATVAINYFHRDHTMQLVLRDGRWLIADFDSTKSALQTYITTEI